VCGVFGFWSKGTASRTGFDGALLRSATRRLAHRGPDGEGFAAWSASGDMVVERDLDDQPLRVGLGHRRLKILDLSEAGRQPMGGPEGCWVSYNGEIFNYRELRRELTARGYRFCSSSDTEVLLAAYAAWGEECLCRFNGMWAFLLYDPARRRLIASRDRLGVKPLYYSATPHGVAFSSEIAPLLSCPGVRPTIATERLGRYLVDRRIDDGTETIYRDIRELRGAHILRLDTDTGAWDVRRYWNLPEEPDLELGDEAALDRFSELIDDAVRLRLHADVPVAITLSGGIDSSVLTVAASQVATKGVQTFTSRFRGQETIDESNYAHQVAQWCRTDEHYVEPSMDRLVDEEVGLTTHQALPFGTLSLYVHWAILARVRQDGVPVVLSGQGGDESFLGYERYYASAVLHAMPHVPRAAAVIWQGSRHSRLGPWSMLQTIAYFVAPRFQRRVRHARTLGLVRSRWFDGLGAPEPEVVGDIRQQQALEFTTLCLPVLLRYDDRTAGALGMETRLPFLDYRVVEFAYRLPLKHKIRHGWTKYLLRRYLARHGLDNIAWRKVKVGFDSPHGAWTRKLIEARGAMLRPLPFVRALLRDDVSLDRVRMPAAWDLYNCAHLASLLDWQVDDAWR